MIKTAIIDMGGVLVNLEWDLMFARMQEHSGVSDVRSVIANGPIVVSAMLGHLNPHAYHETLCEKLDASLTYEEFVDIWNSLLSANETIAPPISRLKLSYRLVLGSNPDAIPFAHALERFPVLQDFEQYFLSYEMGLMKPDPAFFHHILEALEAQADECIFIDDRAENVDAALSVGITAFRFVGVSQLEMDLGQVL